MSTLAHCQRRTTRVRLPHVILKVRLASLSPVGHASHSDDDLFLRVSFSLVPEGFRDLTQGVTLVDDRRDLSGFDELLQNGQVLSVVLFD